MSVQFSKVLVPSPLAWPWQGQWATTATAMFARTGRAVWRGLEAAGQARAEAELRRLAVQYAHQPELARAIRSAIGQTATTREAPMR